MKHSSYVLLWHILKTTADVEKLIQSSTGHIVLLHSLHKRILTNNARFVIKQ